MTVTEIKSFEQFTAIIAGETPVLIDFWAPWCGPCRAISPYVEKLAQKEGVVKFYKVDIDDVPSAAEAVQIRVVPTFMVFKQGEKIDEAQGANFTAIDNLVAKANSL